MALIRCGMECVAGRFGANVLTPVYYDTDDLDQLSYHYYRKAESLKMHGLARQILRRKITGFEIENNPEKYKDIID